MGGMNGQQDDVRFRQESVKVEWLPAESRDEMVARLDRPWVMTEGPLDARLFRFEGDADNEQPLLLRGTAFDSMTTLVWDEAGLQIVRGASPNTEILAVEQDVLVRSRLQGPEKMIRIDYLEGGAWLASRWLEYSEEDSDAQS